MTIMKRTRTRALLGLLGACVVGLLAMAGSAFSEGPPPSWHVEGKPLVGEAVPTVEVAPSRFTISVPGLSTNVKCQTRRATPGLYGSAASVEGTHAWFYLVLTNCAVEVGGFAEPKCVVTNTPEFTFSGLGSGSATELHSNGATTKLDVETGKGCSLAASTKITIPDVTNSYGEEHFALKVNTSGAGTFGAQAATFSGLSFWSLYKSPLWGWTS